MKIKKVNVIGMGYIGLPTALMLAANHVEVVGCDYNTTVLNALNKKELSFQENGLEKLFDQAFQEGILFSPTYVEADCYIISVATPYDKKSKKIDPSFVISAVKGVLEVCPQDAILIIESTVSPGTIDRYVRPLVKEYECSSDRRVHLAHAPERIIPGNMVYELVHNARTIGADSPEVGQAIQTLYASFCKGEIDVTDIRCAEMSKVVENAYRDVNIAFANELAMICQSGNIDVHEVIRIANKHPRVNILSPGPGVGGHCISVDPWFLVGDYPDLANLIKQAREINDSMPDFVMSRIFSILKDEHISSFNKVGFYGLSYKENVDDVRESPTLQLIESMQKHLAETPKCYDPMLQKQIFSTQYMHFDAFLDSIDCLVIMVNHAHLNETHEQIKNKVILDTRKSQICWGDTNKLYLL